MVPENASCRCGQGQIVTGIVHDEGAKNHPHGSTMMPGYPNASGYGNITRANRSERLDRRFGAIGVEFVEARNQAIAPSRCISSFHFEDTIAVLFAVHQPALCSFENRDLVAVQTTTSAEKGFATVNRIVLESVNHDMGSS